MANEQEVYEDIAENIRRFGYRDVTASLVREIDEAPRSDQRQGVVTMFALKQLEEARESGLLPPKR